MKPRFEPHLAALVIGIRKYVLKQISGLPGIVPDANKVVNWLVTGLQVPQNQIFLITDEAASCAGIISAFKALH